jgi:hypothetical protein
MKGYVKKKGYCVDIVLLINVCHYWLGFGGLQCGKSHIQLQSFCAHLTRPTALPAGSYKIGD